MSRNDFPVPPPDCRAPTYDHWQPVADRIADEAHALLPSLIAAVVGFHHSHPGASRLSSVLALEAATDMLRRDLTRQGVSLPSRPSRRRVARRGDGVSL
jgi:hypothetical protein